MTDNAWTYKWSLRTICADRGPIKQIFIKPHCPWQNGKVERLKCATRRPVASPA